ncbi:hypothetical protein HF685_07320 [Parasphingorhabdus halotolerans]|uniref:Uncharacterized protein n=1 Tax=Parasphingorhabdus halotolerans TaxID=2725558 RepID=A0A6H2DLW1_9SPHN|nr:hypothetical protein HF685_07320 [Parasphingorhabdus halotolerans]
MSLGVIATVTVIPGSGFHGRCLCQQIEIKRVVAIFKKCLLAPIPALGDMMRDAEDNDAGKPSQMQGR